MNYTIKTKHQDGKNYVCNSTENIVPALNYAIEMTRGDYPFPLIIEAENRGEICIVFDGRCYKVADSETIVENEWYERDER